MTAAHWHLLLNHVPIIGTIIASFLLIAGLLLRNNQLKIISIILIIIMSVFGFIAHETGERAESEIKQETGINQQAVELHEEASKPAFIAQCAAGILALASLLFYKRRRTVFNLIGVVIIGVAIAATGLMTYAGYLGGKIRHHELSAEQNYMEGSANSIRI